MYKYTTAIFLDDERNPKDVTWVTLPSSTYFIVIRNYTDFVNFVKMNGRPDFVSFDHDLSIEHYPIFENNPGKDIPYDKYKEKTGFDCAKWLVNYCLDKNLDFPAYTVHSMNPVGKDNIISLIESYKKSRKHENN